MAAAAVGAEFSVVHIVRAMAIPAATADVFHLFQRHAVTVITAHTDMRADEREGGLHTMIESPQVPGDRVMAGIAAVLEVASVLVIVAVARNAADIFVLKSLADVTALAFLLFVPAEQREPSQFMIEKYRVLPVELGVAAFTLCAEHALVGIIVPVTRIAAGRESGFENRLYMTVVARDVLMTAEQPVIGMDVVIEERFGPLGAGMAGLTLSAPMPVVGVVFTVAGRARRTHFILEWMLRVTVLAGRFHMSAFEGKVRIARVIKTGVMPAARVVAIFTFLAAATTVGVIRFVTCVAIRRGVQESPVGVTIQACCFPVLADERVLSRIVVKCRVRPFGRLMAAGAIVTHGLLVW